MWLRKAGLHDARGQGSVEVTPISNPDILALFARGDLAGAWVPEPWAARLVAEAGGRILVDERTLWPEGRFPTTVLVVSTRALERRRADVLALVRAHLELTRRWEQDPDGFSRIANAAYGKRTGKPLPDGVLRDAFSRIAPAVDPLTRQLEQMSRDAQALRFAPEGDLSGMVDATMLAELAQR
jgi:NitT/TauT family transport system substrate-binding protein